MDKSTISNNGQTVKEKINAMLPSFSKGQKKLAEYILGNYDTAAFLTAAKLGQKAGVSESTAVSGGYGCFSQKAAGLRREN